MVTSSSDLEETNKQAGNISWMGSSYSGADIKVLVNLYNRIDYTKELEKLQQQQKDANDIADVCGTLKNADYLLILPNQEEIRNLIKNAVGGSLSSEATSTVFDIINRAKSNPSLFIETFAVNEVVYKRTANELQEKLDKLTERSNEALGVLTLATLQTLSIQSHREKIPVRALGYDSPKGFVRGPRTLAGSMICTVFNEHVFRKLMAIADFSQHGSLFKKNEFLLPDQLPPLDLTIMFANEYGSLSRMGIYGVEFVNDSKTFSIEDLFTENVINFVARDVDLMTSIGQVRMSDIGQFSVDDNNGRKVSATDLLTSSRSQYQDYCQRLGIRRSLVTR